MESNVKQLIQEHLEELNEELSFFTGINGELQKGSAYRQSLLQAKSTALVALAITESQNGTLQYLRMNIPDLSSGSPQSE